MQVGRCAECALGCDCTGAQDEDLKDLILHICVDVFVIRLAVSQHCFSILLLLSFFRFRIPC